MGKIKVNFKIPKTRKLRGVPTTVAQTLKVPKGVRIPKAKKLHKKKFF